MVERRLSEDEAAAVFRRAAELDDARATTGGFDRIAIERAAVEVGLAPASVQQALAELDAGKLAARTRSAWRWRDRVASVERVVPVRADEARYELETYLRRQMFRVARRPGVITVWEPATGLTASIVRGTDLHGRIRLKGVSTVTISVHDHPGGCRVCIDLDFKKARSDHRAGAIAGGIVGTTAMLAGAIGVATGAEPMAFAVAGGAAAIGGTFFGTRSGYSAVVEKAVAAVELALDELDNP
jgi:hypothetical protein